MIVMYRPPSAAPFRLFLDEFGAYLEQLALTAGQLLIAGDFNVHVDDSTSAEARQFLSLIDSFELHQHIQSSTHKSHHCLDLVLSRKRVENLDEVVHSWHVQDCCLSDHYAIFLSIKTMKPALKRKEVHYRKTKSVRFEVLQQAILTSSLCNDEVLSGLDINGLVGLYHSELRAILDTLAPVITRTITLRPHAKWFTDEIRQAKQCKRQTERFSIGQPLSIANLTRSPPAWLSGTYQN